MNDLQTFGVLWLMESEQNRADDKAYADLRTNVLLAGIQPQHVLELLETLDGKKAEEEAGLPLFADELTDEEMDEYQPFSVEEAEETIDLMRRFGIAIR